MVAIGDERWPAMGAIDEKCLLRPARVILLVQRTGGPWPRYYFKNWGRGVLWARHTQSQGARQGRESWNRNGTGRTEGRALRWVGT